MGIASWWHFSLEYISFLLFYTKIGLSVELALRLWSFAGIPWHMHSIIEGLWREYMRKYAHPISFCFYLSHFGTAIPLRAEILGSLQ